jgi:hypothetical protein
MPIRPKKRQFGAATVGAALSLGEANPLKKAADAIRDAGGSGAPAPAGRTNESRVRQAFSKRFPHTGKGMGDVRTTPTPIRKAGFGGVTRKDSPSKRKMRNRGPRNR